MEAAIGTRSLRDVRVTGVEFFTGRVTDSVFGRFSEHSAHRLLQLVVD